MGQPASSATPASHAYQPLATAASPGSEAPPSLRLRTSSGLVLLSLSQDGLVVSSTPITSWKRLNCFTTSPAAPNLISYLHLLACSSFPSTASSSSPILSLAALVSTSPSKPHAPLKLWKLEGKVVGVGENGAGLAESEGEEGEGDEEAAVGGVSAETLKKVKEWCIEAESRAYSGVKRHRRLHVIVNPAGGKGKAKRVWEDEVRPMYEAAGAEVVISYTGPPTSPQNALHLGRAHDPQSYDLLVALSGDGILHELFNGLATHSSGRGGDALGKTPVCHVPCGSGNAMATSLLGPERVTDRRWAALAALKGNPIPLDLCAVTQPSLGPSTVKYSFISQAFGLMADLDLGTEHLRFLGDLRFTLGYVLGAVRHAAYPCTLDVLLPSPSYLGGPPTKSTIAARHNRSVETGEGAAVAASVGGEMPRVQRGTVGDQLPSGATWTGRLPSQEELERLGEVAEGAEWVQIDMSGEAAGEKGEGGGKGKGKEGVFFAYGGKVPFVARDLMMFPAADPNDGLIDLVLVEPMGTLEAFGCMDGADTGHLFSHPRLHYLKVLAYRLSFPHPPPTPSSSPSFADHKAHAGNLSIDGERFAYEDVQVECHRGVGRVMAFPGVGKGRGWEGRRRIEVVDRAAK
ncbi:hypothetical protein JCM8097_000708 [Rhodosporidiobolus ruineniae]